MQLIYTLTFIYNSLVFLQYYEEQESFILSAILTTIYVIIFNNLDNGCKGNKTR